MRKPGKRYDPAVVMRLARSTLRLTQRYVAEQLGLTRSAISRMESGKVQIGIHIWFSFCELTHLNYDVALEGYDKTLHLRRVRAAIKRGSSRLTIRNLLERNP